MWNVDWWKSRFREDKNMPVVDPISVANNLKQALAMLLIVRPTASGIIEVDGFMHSGSIKIDKGDLLGFRLNTPNRIGMVQLC